MCFSFPGSYVHFSVWQVAARCLSRPEAAALYLQRAQESELLGQYKDAENLYLEAEEHDLAIKMYRKAHLFDNVIQLVTKYQKVDYISLYIHQFPKKCQLFSFRNF